MLAALAVGFNARANLCEEAVKHYRVLPDNLAYLVERYDIDPDTVKWTPEMKLPVILKMDDHKTLAPTVATGKPAVRLMKKYDVTIVGGGPAGLTAALYLAEAGKSVLIIERNRELGGLGMGSELKGIRAGGGAAYSAGPDGRFEYSIFQKIGLGQYKKKISIEEPIDSYLWKGKLYKGIWEDHTLEELPASFALFKHALLRLADEGAGGDEGDLAKWADNMTMTQLVRQMPELVSGWKDAKSRRMLKRFSDDTELPADDPMKDVIDLLDLYGRSALGGTADKISARQFIDFYESEIYTRYTGTLGTGNISEALLNKLKAYSDLVHFRTSSPVTSVENGNNNARTSFIENGVAKVAVSDRVIFASPITLAPKIVKGLAEADPEKLRVINQIEMTDYAVHVVRLKGHPYRDTYDTWVYNDGDLTKPTDFILGRWQDGKIKAYEGMRNFEKNPDDNYGIITIYQPVGASNTENFNEAANLKMVEGAVQNMLERLKPLTAEKGQPIEIELIESFRWPYSIHIVSPGYLEKIPILARPTGRIYYANNTVAAPELETAMARGATTAIKILKGQER